MLSVKAIKAADTVPYLKSLEPVARWRYDPTENQIQSTTLRWQTL